MIRIVLVRPSQPRNVGAVARAAANFGAESVRLVAPAEWNEESEREARVAASGGWEHVPVHVHGDLPDALSGCAVVVGTSARQREHPAVCSTPAQLIEKLGAETDVAFVFGPESQGLSASELDLCHEWVQIPSTQEFASLNLAQAVVIVLYEWARGSRRLTSQKSDVVCASRETVEAWLNLAGDRGVSDVAVLRHLLYRAQVTEREMGALFELV